MTAAAPAIVTTEALTAEAANAAKTKAATVVCESGGCCITASHDFYNVERGDPLPYKLPIEKQREIGLGQMVFSDEMQLRQLLQKMLPDFRLPHHIADVDEVAAARLTRRAVILRALFGVCVHRVLE